MTRTRFNIFELDVSMLSSQTLAIQLVKIAINSLAKGSSFCLLFFKIKLGLNLDQFLYRCQCPSSVHILNQSKGTFVNKLSFTGCSKIENCSFQLINAVPKVSTRVPEIGRERPGNDFFVVTRAMQFTRACRVIYPSLHLSASVTRQE